jgi:hypothetical protein
MSISKTTKIIISAIFPRNPITKRFPGGRKHACKPYLARVAWHQNDWARRMIAKYFLCKIVAVLVSFANFMTIS